jgi:cholinesterase
MRRRTAGLTVILALFFGVSAPAAPLNALVVFGDSLSDDGNLYGVIGQPGPPDNFPGRVSNGIVAVEYLAANLGLPLFNFAWAGATTGVGNYVDGGTIDGFGSLNLPGMSTVYAQWAASQPPGGLLLPEALYLFWGGANNVFSNPATALQGVQHVLAIVGDLEARGATSILVPGMPDLGLTPSGLAGDSAGLTALSAAFNAQLQAGLQGLNATYFDTFGLFRDVVAHPASYGFVNVDTPCRFVPACLANPALQDAFLFWDGVHPTTAAHRALALQFQAAVVPEPVLALLVGLGASLAAARRRVAR